MLPTDMLSAARELDDVRKARTQSSGKGKAEKRFTEVQELLEELNDLSTRLARLLNLDRPRTTTKATKRETRADPTSALMSLEVTRIALDSAPNRPN